MSGITKLSECIERLDGRLGGELKPVVEEAKAAIAGLVDEQAARLRMEIAELEQLREQVERHGRWREGIDSLIECFCRGGGENGSHESLHYAFLRRLALISDCRAAVIAAATSPEARRVRTIAFWLDGAFADNVEHGVAGTCCERILTHDLCFIPSGVQTLFPGDAMLRELNAQSYIGAPLKDAAGNCLGILAVINDKDFEDPACIRTLVALGADRLGLELERRVVDVEMIEAHQLADAAVRARSLFLANMSHEIRTPLNGAYGMVNLLLASNLSPEQRDFALAARSSCQDLIEVIDNLLDFSRLEAGQLTLKTASFDLREMLSRALDGFRQKADAKSLSLVLDVAPELAIDVAGDPIRIRQVIKNLLSNAVKFTAAGGVHLRARLLKAFSDRVVVRIEVEDTGIGIPLDEQAGLFEPFFQVDPSFTRNFGGTGLGLAIVKLLLERMGGQVGVESQPNKGSRFWFSLCLRRSCGDGSPLK